MTNKACKLTDSKLVVLGSAGVGKSALIVRYLTKRFIWEYDPTLEFTYKHQTQIDDETIQLEILDTAAQDQSALLDANVRWGEGFMLVYSVTDRQAFLHTAHIRRCLDDVAKTKNVPCVLVGNKTDLQHERQVSTEEGERLAAELVCAFYETSASDGGPEIEEAFHELHREVRRRRGVEGKARRRSSAHAQVKQVLNKMFTKIQSGNT